jgi:hypothetical protein
MTDVNFAAVHSHECYIEATPMAWTIYWCALSLHGPRNLHPQALHLAARFIRGDDMEKYLIAKTVLAWRGLPRPPLPDSPLFNAVRDLAWIATSLDWWPTLPDAASLMLPQNHDDGLSALLDRNKPWSERNIIALNARLDLDIGRAPQRDAPVKQEAHLGSPYVDNNEAAMLAVIFSLIEGTTCSVWEFDARETRFPIIGGRDDVWVVKSKR